MALSFPDISEDVKNQLITFARSHKIERRLSLRSQIILDWMKGLTYQASSKKNGVTETVIAK